MQNPDKKIREIIRNLEQIERHNLICSIKGIEDWETIWPVGKVTNRQCETSQHE